ncbi:L-galactono-1,4-lactone dehydorogenase [Reticulomyxa filosa]|uniref:L-galactono-1,4-lactone dehydorogenase n=1 Tax=Reticulomyxa filosa TaxID=46433 RepID=X6MW43_RETFI|nr:L-galactono-1,4-lactone dehydorogenase [Reticulomyxa filosa]|eukprot:ETO18044.1 L-galactono-1,4-lactone dehydorogenase [Reticulomyxa filosa]
MNSVLYIDAKNMKVTVQSGCTVQQVLKAIRPYGMTLENIPSIMTQQMSGLTQVSAQGMRLDLCPCNTQMVPLIANDQSLQCAAGGVIRTRRRQSNLFPFVRVGLGRLGVVTQMTLQCVKSHKLKGEVRVYSHKELTKKIADDSWLQAHQQTTTGQPQGFHGLVGSFIRNLNQCELFYWKRREHVHLTEGDHVRWNDDILGFDGKKLCAHDLLGKSDQFLEIYLVDNKYIYNYFLIKCILELYGSTLFQPLLSKAVASAVHSNVKNKIQYFTLLVLACDIVLAANKYLSLSIIIVGVGLADFTQTEALKGEAAKRDIAEFVSLRDYSKPLKGANGHVIGFTDTLRGTFQRKFEGNSTTIYELYQNS